MIPGRFATIISGALKAWGIEDHCVLKTEGFSCLITLNSNVIVEVIYEEQSFGSIWRIREKDQKESLRAQGAEPTPRQVETAKRHEAPVR